MNETLSAVRTLLREAEAVVVGAGSVYLPPPVSHMQAVGFMRNSEILLSTTE